jgi:manganese transport protein
MKIKLSIGPAALVTAAFIGPGTLTLCILAGVQHGFSLLWAMLLSVLITIFIQNTAARIAWTTRKGLAQNSLNQVASPALKLALAALLISAIFIGNAAYEAGNLSGALLGLKGLFGESTFLFGELDTLPLLLGLVVGYLLLKGNFKWLKQLLVAIVILMSLSFLLTAALTQPNLGEVLSGLFLPSFQSDELLTIVGLLGTTVVPYNLFLHSAMVAASPNISLEELRRDTLVAVGLGGVVSLCIIIAAASLEGNSLTNAADLGEALAPLYGAAAPVFMQFGFFAAGLTSALTAPMAAGFVVAECFQWSTKSWGYRLTALSVLLVGVAFTLLGAVPLEIIRFAQIANGILLPVTGLLLLFTVNNSSLMKSARPSFFQNAIFVFIEVFFIFLGVKSLGHLF